MGLDENKAAARNFLKELDKDFSSAIQMFFAPDCAAHLPAGVGTTDRAGFQQFVAMLYTAFPDLHHAVEQQIAEGDMVVTIIDVRGTHGGDFLGFAPTGKTVVFQDVMIWRMQRGKVVELGAQFDAVGLLRQLGVFPSPPAKL